MSKNKLYGVDDEKYDEAYNKPFEASSSVIESDKTTDNALSNLESLTSKEGIISDDVKNSLNVQFEMPKEVTAADGYLSSTLSKIQSGKTSYTDQVRDMMDKIMNRDKFSYDVDTDPLFQQALASSMNAGKQAMQDTIGQASSLTGGYGSTYATSAGNQAYNSFIEEAYDNLPQYYQMELEAYQMEGDEMYRQYGMLADADDREYNRNVTGFNSTLSYRNQIYNEAYGQYRDSKSDAFAMANLEISEHGQLVSDAYNYYNAASNYSDKLYEREYSKWADEVNMALKEVEMLNSDAWSEKNFDEGVRQYEKNFAENQRQYNESLAEQKRQHNETMSYNWASLNQKRGSGSETPTQTMMSNALKAYNEGGTAELKKYLGSIPEEYDISGITDYVAEYGDAWVADYDNFSGWEISDDTYNGGWLFGLNWLGGGEDHNDVFSKGEETKTYDDLKKEINASNLPQEKKDELLKKLQNQSKK